MNNSVIVSITNEEGTYIEDYEIPINVKMRDWISQIHDYICSSRREYFRNASDNSSLILKYNNIILKESDTMYGLNIMDGSVMTAIWR